MHILYLPCITHKHSYSRLYMEPMSKSATQLRMAPFEKSQSLCYTNGFRFFFCYEYFSNIAVCDEWWLHRLLFLWAFFYFVCLNSIYPFPLKPTLRTVPLCEMSTVASCIPNYRLKETGFLRRSGMPATYAISQIWWIMWINNYSLLTEEWSILTLALIPFQWTAIKLIRFIIWSRQEDDSSMWRWVKRINYLPKDNNVYPLYKHTHIDNIMSSN